MNVTSLTLPRSARHHDICCCNLLCTHCCTAAPPPCQHSFETFSLRNKAPAIYYTRLPQNYWRAPPDLSSRLPCPESRGRGILHVNSTRVIARPHSVYREYGSCGVSRPLLSMTSGREFQRHASPHFDSHPTVHSHNTIPHTSPHRTRNIFPNRPSVLPSVVVSPVERPRPGRTPLRARDVTLHRDTDASWPITGNPCWHPPAQSPASRVRVIHLARFASRDMRCGIRDIRPRWCAHKQEPWYM
jgi:hypothetical protein